MRSILLFMLAMTLAPGGSPSPPVERINTYTNEFARITRYMEHRGFDEAPSVPAGWERITHLPESRDYKLYVKGSIRARPPVLVEVILSSPYAHVDFAGDTGEINPIRGEIPKLINLEKE